MTFDQTLFSETFCRATDALILPSKRAFFPIKIPNLHTQLRHYISTADPDLIYFATGADVCSLQLSTQKGNLITSLPFEPRCLAAGFGWICVGGEKNGLCAFIRIAEEDEVRDRPVNLRTPAEVDALLPLDLDPSLRRHFDRPLAQPPVSSSLRRQKPEFSIHELGGDIVNSVTVFRIPGDGKNVSPEDLCIMSNNDCTVKIYSLTQSRVLDTLEHPAPTNYASISPSGSVLAVVGDEHRAYFYRRAKLPGLIAHGNKSLVKFQWKLFSSPTLPNDTYHEESFWFTITFSPSGHLCAAASQAGIITVFDMNLLQTFEDEADAIVCSFRSSGRNGPVRSLSFCPDPWDLLAWAEQSGRVGVTDIRAHFRRRQVLELNVHSPDLERRDIADHLDPEIEFNPESRAIRAHLDVIDDDGPTPAMVDYMEAAAERRRLRRPPRESSPHGLSEREQQIFRALRTSRQRVSEIESSLGPYSVNYGAPIGHPSRAPGNHDPDEPRTGPLQTIGTLREFIRERNRASERGAEHAERNLNPRRRSSVVLSQGNTSGANPSHPTGSILSPSRPGGTGASTLTVSPARLLSPGEPNSNSAALSFLSVSDAWQTIEAAHSASPGPSLPEASTRLRREEAAIQANFERRQAEEARLETERLMRTRLGPRNRLTAAAEDLGYYRRYHDPEDVGTAGLGWSDDGRQLYIGTEEGILEYHVNIQDRKFFPNWETR